MGRRPEGPGTCGKGGLTEGTIDYYDRLSHSEDVSDPAKTHRMLTTMLAGEY
jgi:hypothetical protein